MANCLVSNVAGRNHAKIYAVISKGAFFDLTPEQSGWNEFLKIVAGDIVYVINESRKVAVGYKVDRVMTGVQLAEDPVWGNRVASESGGRSAVLFGSVCERVDMEYSKFVKRRNICSAKLNPQSGQMYQGFNCAVF